MAREKIKRAKCAWDHRDCYSYLKDIGGACWCLADPVILGRKDCPFYKKESPSMNRDMIERQCKAYAEAYASERKEKEDDAGKTDSHNAA